MRDETPRAIPFFDRQLSPAFLRTCLGVAIVIVLGLINHVFHGRTRPVAVAGGEQASGKAALGDLPSQEGGTRVGGIGGRAPSVSVLGKQGDSISVRARVLNVFRMQKSLAAVTEASVFIHATFADDIPEWVQAGKTVQLEGRISEVKTKTNIYLSANHVTSLL